MRRGHPRSERGSATVWTVALAAVLAVIGGAVVLVGAAVVARHRAAAAADLAALAAAGRAVLGDATPCAVAAEVAAANGATLDSCEVGAEAVVELRVHVPVRLGPLGVVDARARARAGPAAPEAGRAAPARQRSWSPVAAAGPATLSPSGRPPSGGLELPTSRSRR